MRTPPRYARLFALMYGLATLFAQWPHDHRPHAESELRPLAGCEDPTPHFAAHEDAEAVAGTLDCPICSHRNLAPHLEVGLSVVAAPDAESASTFLRSLAAPVRSLPARSRAPPLC